VRTAIEQAVVAVPAAQDIPAKMTAIKDSYKMVVLE
jgi:hypothetical protein